MNPDPFGLVGQVLDGQFRVDQFVGEGGFSAVYRGHHQGLNEPIAIKCLKLPASLGTALVDTFVQRFRDESRILYRLSQGNLNVVRSIAAGTTQAPATGALVPYMVLEWLEGRSMQNDFIVRRTVGEKGRSLDELVKLFDTAADGLAYAHAQGVAHRDLNPGNLFLAQTSHGVKMKVLDFGVAKLMHDGALNMGPRAQTIGQIKIFAPAYGAPEQFDDRVGQVGSHSDVYSFALVLLEAMRDKCAVDGNHIGEFAEAACNPNRRPTPRMLGVDVPDEVETAFARATALDPKQRWHSVGDFWKSLTIAQKMATERKYENAALETPALTLGGMGGMGGPLAPERPAPKEAAVGGRTPMAKTIPLGTNTPGLPPARPGRQRMPTAIGIPMPANRPAGMPSPVAPLGSTRTMSSPGQNPSGLTAPAAPPRPARPPSNPPGVPRIPTPAPFPRVGSSPDLKRGGSDRPQQPPPSARFGNSPSKPRIPAAMPMPAPPRPPLPGDLDDEQEEDEATKVHAPTQEVLRTLALHDAATARAQAEAMAAAHNAQMQGKTAELPHAQAHQAHGQSAYSDDAAALEAAARAAGPITPAPPSGATLMMAPAPIPPLPPLPMGSFPGAPPPMGAHPAAPHGGPPPMGGPPPPQHPASGAMGAMPKVTTPGVGFTPAPPYHGSSIQNAPGSMQSAPGSMQSAPGSMQNAPGSMQNTLGMQGAPPAPHPQHSHMPQSAPGMPPPYAQAGSMVPSQPSMQPPFGAASQGGQSYNRPPNEQPFAHQAQAPAKGLPILPIAIMLGVLALGGVTLGFFALRARSAASAAKDVPSATAPASVSAAAVDPVAADPPPVPTAPVAAADAASELMEIAEEDAAIMATGNASAAPSASAAPPASAAATVAATTAATTAAPVVTVAPPPNPFTAPPPPTASAKPAADPNAFNEGAARAKLAQANGVLVFCKQEGGVTGPGNASVVFGLDGTVSGVTIDPPYAGTKEGNCAAGHFRRAKVTPFTGSPQTIRHSFEVPK